jgi:hypothetical protein
VHLSGGTEKRLKMSARISRPKQQISRTCSTGDNNYRRYVLSLTRNAVPVNMRRAILYGELDSPTMSGGQSGDWRMQYSGMWRHVDLVWTDVPEELIRELATSVSRYLQTVCSLMLTQVPRSGILLQWRWRRYVPPEHQFTQDLHGAASQKMAFFIVAAVKTSNLTKWSLSKEMALNVLQWKWY